MNQHTPTFKCDSCNGTGRYADYDHCEDCHGTGKRAMSERFDIIDGPNKVIWDRMKREHAAHCPCGCHVRDASKMQAIAKAEEL